MAIARAFEAVSVSDRATRRPDLSPNPFEQPTKYALTVNLRTARALALTVPLSCCCVPTT
jgi:hypothetical protein